MKQILLRLDGSGKIPEELLREIRDSQEEVELIFDAEEYDELFPMMQKLFDEISLGRIQRAKQKQEEIRSKVEAHKKIVRAPVSAKKVQPKGSERRQLPRWSIQRQAKIRLAKFKEFSSCFIEDMNVKGMRLALSQPLVSQGVVRMLIVLSDNLDLELEAEIPWVKQEQGKYVHGVMFNRIKDADKDRVFQYINSHCSDQLKNQWWA